MGWDKNQRYYTRSRRVNGRVVREYVGGGLVGKLAPQLDAIEHDKRETERGVARARQQANATLDAPLIELDELADLLVAAAMSATGYHQHNRGEWRKRRDNRSEDE